MDAVKQPARGSRRGAQILSSILFLAALGFAAAGIYLYFFTDEEPPREPAIPTTTPGRNGLADVIRAFDTAGLDADYGRSPATADTSQIRTPGQHAVVDDRSVFIFTFPGTNADAARAAREEAAARVDPATMTLATRGGQSIGEGETLRAFQGSNVIAVLVGGDDALAAQVQAVIESLP
ncbi:MAG: hypothetical protein H0W23_00775 [Chloroflexia bacterium]|nr:hypothetical protein [Chloroflexia bacterium]